MTDALALPRPVLDLSGPKLRAALEQLITAAESVGGIERLAEAVRLKAEVFQDRLGNGRAAEIERAEFEQLTALMATVRRRIGPLIVSVGWPEMRRAIAALLHEAQVPGTADARFANFETHVSLSPRGDRAPAWQTLPADRRAGAGQTRSPSLAAAPHADPRAVKARRGDARFIRDLAAELLHGVHPEHYPLMTRWVWDATANTGVLREIWHGDDVDRRVIDVPDTHETFLVLREELSQFLSDNGIFRDMLWYVDLLQAQIYANYIGTQGGAYLKADFQAIGDPLEHTRRILGLDLRKTENRDIGKSGNGGRVM